MAELRAITLCGTTKERSRATFLRPIPKATRQHKIQIRTLPNYPTPGGQRQEVLSWIMSLAYRIVFECPKGHNINLQKKCGTVSMSEADAIKLFGDEELSCSNPACRWHGKASKAKLVRILPFNWILSPAT